MTIACQGIDTAVLGITPNLAVEWGYNLYLIETLPESSAIRQNALRAVAELEALFATFPLGSRERTYVTSLRLAANSFARGIERRKRMLNARLAAAREEKDKLVSKYSKSEKLGGFISASFKPLLAGGVVWACLQALFLIPAINHNPGDQEIHRYVSTAFAMFTTLISAWVKGWLTGRRLVKLFNNYDAALKRAQETYSNEVVGEYKFTADSARSAWRQLTGQDPPAGSKAFDTVLLGLMTACDRDSIVAVSEPETKPDEAPAPTG